MLGVPHNTTNKCNLVQFLIRNTKEQRSGVKDSDSFIEETGMLQPCTCCLKPLLLIYFRFLDFSLLCELLFFGQSVVADHV